MIFKDFIKTGQVRTSSKDISLSKSLYMTALNDLEYLKIQEITKISARKIVVNYYDCLRQILESMSSLDSYKIYQHEAFKYYLIEKDENVISEKFDRFRKIRNKINYYGEDISIDEAKEVTQEIKRIIDVLINKYLRRIF